MTGPALTQDLVNLIGQKRAAPEAFLRRAHPRKRRLLNMTIIGGTLAAAVNRRSCGRWPIVHHMAQAEYLKCVEAAAFLAR